MVCPKPRHRHTVERIRRMLLESQELEAYVAEVPAWLHEGLDEAQVAEREPDPPHTGELGLPVRTARYVCVTTLCARSSRLRQVVEHELIVAQWRRNEEGA